MRSLGFSDLFIAASRIKTKSLRWELKSRTVVRVLVLETELLQGKTTTGNEIGGDSVGRRRCGIRGFGRSDSVPASYGEHLIRADARPQRLNTAQYTI